MTRPHPTLPVWIAIALAASCGPNLSGSCPNQPAGTGGELAQNEGSSSGPEEPTKSAAPMATEMHAHHLEPVTAAGADGGTAQPAEQGQTGAPSEAAAAPSPGGGGKFNITGNVTSGGKPAKFAVVFLEDAPTEPTRGMKATIDQRMMMFMPYVSVVAVGGSATFINSDPFPHNVFSVGTERFDLGTIPKGGAGRYLVKKPGPYTLLCNVHPGMLGYLYGAPSSYFATTNAKGQYTIKQVPEGTYKINAWAPKLSAQPKRVTVKGADAPVDLELAKQ